MKRCVIHADEKRGDEYSIIVEGSDFRGVLSEPGIDGRYTNFNNALIVSEVEFKSLRVFLLLNYVQLVHSRCFLDL